MPQLHVNDMMVESAVKSPLDKSTIFSIYPRAITERKVSLFPSDYTIPAGSAEKPGRLLVETGSWWRVIYSHHNDKDQIIEIPVSSIAISKSIIDDWANGLFGVSMGRAMPGLFRIDGDISIAELHEKYKDRLLIAVQQQNRWYEALVNSADSMFARSNGNPLAISDDMRLAAHALGQKTKPWLQDFRATEMINCTACGNLRNPMFPICPNCKTVIDSVKARQLGLIPSEEKV